MTTLISQYFKRQLNKMNYPTDDVRFSLNYCQGDGMAFYGAIESIDSEALADRLLTGHQKAAAKRAIDKGALISITPNSLGHRYSHFNTMTVDSRDSYHCDMTSYEEVALDALVEAIEKDVEALSQRLAREGYKLHEAGSAVWELSERTRVFSTQRFEVKIAEVEDEFASIEDYEEDEHDHLFAGFINRTHRYFSLQVTITGIQTGFEMASVTVGGLIWTNEHPSRTYDGLVTEMLRDAVTEARAAGRSLQLAA